MIKSFGEAIDVFIKTNRNAQEKLINFLQSAPDEVKQRMREDKTNFIFYSNENIGWHIYIDKKTFILSMKDHGYFEKQLRINKENFNKVGNENPFGIFKTSCHLYKVFNGKDNRNRFIPYEQSFRTYINPGQEI